MLPTQLVNVQNFKPASTSKIALLLPLNGQAAVFGRTIQQGFEAAKNGTTPVTGSAVPTQAAQAANVNDVVSPSAAETSDLTTAQTPAQGTMQNPVTAPTTATPAPAETQAAPATDAASEQPQPQNVQPAPPAEQTAQPAAQTPPVATTSANPGAELKIYDTSSKPLDQVLAQVQQDGASIVVGPLLKNNVEELMKSNTTLNVLALNQPEQVQNRANICYFALSPEDEARDAARHIHEQGKQAPLLLIHAVRWGIALLMLLPMSGRSWAAALCCSRNSAPRLNCARASMVERALPSTAARSAQACRSSRV